VLVGTAAGPTRLLINTIGNKNHWIGLRLAIPVSTPPRPQGAAPPAPALRDALGARVVVMRQTGPALMRRARSDGSYASANDPRVVVGLGSSKDPVRLKVIWPDGRSEEFDNTAIDRFTTLVEGSAK
jgi:hypothetical protein